ncbi:MAG: hypothetical protein PHT69_08465 [Bacteroidales bacterium]|nr:hypothetical protein [Bacteroidales bacterium]
MKKNVFILVIGMFFLVGNIFSQEENKKLEFKPYGFVKGDMIYTMGGVYSFGNVANCYNSSPQFASGLDTTAIGFTGQHSRLGFKASTGEKIKVSGLLEIDFYEGPINSNVKPRMRLGYVSVSKGGFEARFGQQWDLYSSLNPNTNNTNGNMWYAGNKGFRRGQIQLSYVLKNDKISPMIQLSVGETTREDAGIGKDNISGIPMLQGRVSAKILDKYSLGVSYAYGTYLEKKGLIETGVGLGIADTLLSDFTVNTSGISVDLSLPIHKYFSLNGEFNTGTNLNNANLFSVAGNYSWSIHDSLKTLSVSDKNSMGMWFNAQSNITDWFQVVVGFGMDNNTSETFAVNNIEKNTVVYGDLIFPIKHGFSIALEVMNINTTVVSKVDVNKKITERKSNIANVVNLSAKVNF